MQVFIVQAGGPLTNSGAELRKRAKIEDINVHGGALLDLAPFTAFAQANQQGFQVGDASNALLIFGGRKSIIAELTAAALALRPAPGQGLAVRIIRQTEAARSVGQTVVLGVMLPEVAVSHGIKGASTLAPNPDTSRKFDSTRGVFYTRKAIRTGVSVPKAIAGTFKTAVAYAETLDRIGKKYTYLQLYSGATQPGDIAVGNGNAPVSTSALATQLLGIKNWAD